MRLIRLSNSIRDKIQMKTSKCQKWQSPNSRCLQWPPAAFLQVSFWSNPWPGKAAWPWGHVTAFSCSKVWVLNSRTAPDPQVLCSWGPLSPNINGLSFIPRVLCPEDTFFVNQHTTSYSPKRAERNKRRIQEFICCNVQDIFSFPASIKLSDMKNINSSYTISFLFLCYHC